MRRKKRDLSRAQFEQQARKLGCKNQGFMGYWELPASCGTARLSVSVLNAGKRRRDQLAYLKRCIAREKSLNGIS